MPAGKDQGEAKGRFWTANGEGRRDEESIAIARELAIAMQLHKERQSAQQKHCTGEDERGKGRKRGVL